MATPSDHMEFAFGRDRRMYRSMADSFAFIRQVRRGWAKSLRAARFNLLPASLLLVCGIALVAAYYRIPEVSAALAHIERWREETGVLFPIVSTAFFGGLFPILVRRAFLGSKETLGGAIFLILLWAEKGWEVNLLYQIQAQVWGNDAEVTTLIAKVATDQFIYGPLIATPSLTLAYLWREASFSIAGVREQLREVSFLERAIPVMIANWVVWLPAVSVIYTFPLPLQLPLQNIILSIFVLILALVAANEGDVKEPHRRRRMREAWKGASGRGPRAPDETSGQTS